MTRSVRSIWTFSASAVFAVVTLLLGLLATPMLVRALGDERFGASRALLDWFGYLGLLELGIGGAMLPLIARELARGHESNLSGVVSAGARAYRLIAVWTLIGGGVLTLAAPWLVPVSRELRGELVLAGLALSIAGGMILLSPIRQYLEAAQRSYLVVWALLAQAVVLTVLWVALAWAGLGIASQAVATLVAGVILHGLLLGMVWRRRREVVRALFRPKSDEPARAELWRLNWRTFAVNAAGRVSLLSDNIVIGLLLSPAMVTPFLLTQRLAQIAQAQLQNIGSAGWAALAELVHRGEHEAMRARFLELTRATTALGVVMLVPIAAYNPAFMKLWVGAERYAGDALTGLAACNALVWAISSLWGWLFSGTGRIGLLIWPMACSAAVNLSVSLGITWFGSRGGSNVAILGPVIGTGVSMAFINLPWLAELLRREFQIPRRRLAGAVASPMLLLSLPAVLTAWFARAFPPTGWLSLIAGVLGAAGALAAVTWLAVLSSEERALWRVRLRLAIITLFPTKSL